MNRTDLIILSAVQRDSSQSIAQIAEKAALSSSACHRRLRALEDEGFIRSYSARLDPRKLGLGLQVFVELSLTSQSQETMDRFEEAVGRFDDILECHLMSGSADYILRVAATDMDHFDIIHRTCLSRLPGVSAMHSSFVIRRIKEWKGYSLERLQSSGPPSA
jgi:Lrp/AsnC family transcriptional regulator, leucine-responsive regulatory protein